MSTLTFTYSTNDRDFISLKDSSRESLPIALIGDVAHLISLFKGQGANQTLLDALDLTEILTNNSDKDLYLLIDQYEERIFSRK